MLKIESGAKGILAISLHFANEVARSRQLTEEAPDLEGLAPTNHERRQAGARRSPRRGYPSE